jgi:acetylornithine aminotransferase
MIELVQGEGGVEPLDKKKVQALEKLLKEKDILLIVDEVQTGIFRTGKFLASNLYEIEPDIVTLAKGLGGGVPIGAVMTTKKDVLKAGDHGSTYGGNYLVTRASLEVISILEKLELKETIEYFSSKLENLANKYPTIITKSVGVGLMRGLRIKDGDTLSSLINEAFKEGVLVLKAGRNTLRFLPPLTITKDEIDEGFKRVEKAFDTIS